MTATAAPLSAETRGGGNYVLTRREIKAHLLATFPNLTESAAERTGHAALDLRRVRPELDVLRWAEADVQRRRKLAGLPLLLRGFDPTGNTAARNVDATRGASE